MPKNFRVEETTVDEYWDSLISDSEEGSAFAKSDFLLSLKSEIKAYIVYNNNEPRALGYFPVSGDNIVENEFLIYFGLAFCKKPKNQNYHQFQTEKFEITTFFLDEIGSKFRDIFLQLSPSIVDTRPYLWYNYDGAGPTYTPDIRYTAIVDLSQINSEQDLDSDLFLEFSSSRRQEVRYAIKKGVETKQEFNAKEFVRFYKETMERQGEDVEKAFLDEMNELLEALSKFDWCNMFVSYTAEGEPGSMAFFIHDHDKVYYLLGANDPKFRNAHTGTAVLWDAMRFYAKKGLKIMDLEGVNSPRRGWFKLSFGARILPYYSFHLSQEK